jgi:hypothetical protein
MDRAMQLRHLAQAERHIVLGERHIVDQEELIVRLDLRGHDTTIASALLENFRLSQTQHIAHRDRILLELKR